MVMYLNANITNEVDKYNIENVNFCLSDVNLVYNRDIVLDEDFKVFYNEFIKGIKQYNVTEIICFDDNFVFAFQWNCRRLGLNHRIHKVKFSSVYDKYYEYFEDYDFDLDVLRKAFDIEESANGVKSLYDNVSSLEGRVSEFKEYLELVKDVMKVREQLKDYSVDKLNFFANYLLDKECKFEVFLSSKSSSDSLVTETTETIINDEGIENDKEVDNTIENVSEESVIEVEETVSVNEGVISESAAVSILGPEDDENFSNKDNSLDDLETPSITGLRKDGKGIFSALTKLKPLSTDFDVK